MTFRILQKSGFSWKRLLAKIVLYFFIFVLFLYIIYSFLFGLKAKHNALGAYPYCHYDIQLLGASVSHYQKWESEYSFVSDSLKTFSSGGVIYNGENAIAVSSMQIDSDSYDVFYKIFSKKFFIKLDDGIATLPNSIFFAFRAAKNLGVKVGDTIDFFGTEKQVAGIYEDALFQILNRDAVTLWDGKYTHGKETSEIGMGWPDFFDFYSKVYVVFNDYEKGLSFFQKTYFEQSNFIQDFLQDPSHSDYVTEYGEEWVTRVLEDVSNGTLASPVDKYKKDSILLWKTVYEYAKRDYQDNYDTTSDAFYSSLCLAALFAVCILESYFHAKRNQEKVAILRLLGTRRSTIFWFYFLRTFAVEMIIMTASLLCMRLLTYANVYISPVLISSWFGGFAAVIAVAALLSALVTMRKLRDSHLLLCLNEER